jgi:Family of unknown function (DUF6922)
MIKPQEALKPFFWETDLEKMDIRLHKTYIIERILELGDKPAVQWLFTTYSLSEIKDILEKSRNVSSKSRNYWDIVLRT